MVLLSLTKNKSENYICC